jgi:hypothetical protein
MCGTSDDGRHYCTTTQMLMAAARGEVVESEPWIPTQEELEKAEMDELWLAAFWVAGTSDPQSE